MRRFGLLGYPLTHSFSQKYFTEKFALLGLTDCIYENFSVQKIEELNSILEDSTLTGFNITIPYKKQILVFLTHASDAVTKMGACNCVHIVNGNLYGYNTDVIGFEKSLLAYIKPHHSNALILGTGGASAAVAFVLNTLGITSQFVSRIASDMAISYDSLDEQMILSHPLIINTSPVGMFPNDHEFPNLPYRFLSEQHHLYDLTYNPAETKFLEKGRLQGATTQNGQEMLMIQAEESWRIWNS